MGRTDPLLRRTDPIPGDQYILKSLNDHSKYKKIVVCVLIYDTIEYMSKCLHFLPKRPHYFFRLKIILPKRPHFFIAKTARLIFFFLLKRWYHVWYIVIQDLSSKYIYCIYSLYMFILHQTTTNLYIYTLR